LRLYRYVGPEDILTQVRTHPAGRRLDAGPIPSEMLTFVVDIGGEMLLAARRSEHVMCAGGRDVLAAGEIEFEGGEVTYVSNQSTGYCPDVSSWPVVAPALDRAGIGRPDAYSAEFIFRRCPTCAAVNIVKDDDFTCAVCESELPAEWNVA
jgi:hypothetical protein